MAMGILVWSAQVRDLLGKSSLWVTGKGRVPGTGFMGLGLSVPNSLSLITFQIFVHLLHLIAQNVAELFILNSSVRDGVRGRGTEDVSRGSVTGLKIV